MSALLGKIAKTVTSVVHSREVQHDVALFAGIFIATATAGDIAGHGASIGWDTLVAAFVTAFRRALVLRLQGK